MPPCASLAKTLDLGSEHQLLYLPSFALFFLFPASLPFFSPSLRLSLLHSFIKKESKNSKSLEMISAF